MCERLNGARTGGIRDGRPLENGLVIGQVALAVIIAAGAALLVRSVANCTRSQPGVRVEREWPSSTWFWRRSIRAGRKQILDELGRRSVIFPA